MRLGARYEGAKLMYCFFREGRIAPLLCERPSPEDPVSRIVCSFYSLPSYPPGRLFCMFWRRVHYKPNVEYSSPRVPSHLHLKSTTPGCDFSVSFLKVHDHPVGVRSSRRDFHALSRLLLPRDGPIRRRRHPRRRLWGKATAMLPLPLLLWGTSGWPRAVMRVGSPG